MHLLRTLDAFRYRVPLTTVVIVERRWNELQQKTIGVRTTAIISTRHMIPIAGVAGERYLACIWAPKAGYLYDAYSGERTQPSLISTSCEILQE